ncbi:MAG: serine/threonine protein kinase [Myxococcales bacterium]|nr:serine/threonine protein kinase [Myxococcales bacterium]
MSTELFLALTPDWVIKAVEAGGFVPTGHVMALHCLENRVYDLRLESGEHVVAKFYRPGRWSKEAIAEEHQFLFELQEAEIPVCAPLRFANGESIHTVEDIHYAVWPRTGGRSPEEFTDEQVGILGRLVARIHNVGGLSGVSHRPTLDSDSYGFDALEVIEDAPWMPPHLVERYGDAVERIVDVYDELIQGVPLHRIHADCHHGNLLNGPDGWFFLDFDDFRMGPAVQDVWLLVPGRDEQAAQQRKEFVVAYQQFRAFELSWMRLVEPLRGLRYVHYSAWVARRWKDPAFPMTFPQYEETTYWEREVRDLEEQADRCEREIYTQYG